MLKKKQFLKKGGQGKIKKQISALYMRNFIFGVEDSLVSTVGMLSGIAITGVPKNIIVMSGLILVFVEAFSMGVGSLLSEHSTQEFLNPKYIKHKRVAIAALIMFVSYFVAGFIPLVPYLFWPVCTGIGISIVFSLISLMLLGIISGKVFKSGIWHKLLEMVLIGGVAILIGVLVGGWAQKLLM